MFTITFLYHISLLGAVYFLCRSFSRNPTGRQFAILAIGGLLAASLFALIFGDTNALFYIPDENQERHLYSNLRLWAQGLFLEGTLFLFVCSLILFARQRKKRSSHWAEKECSSKETVDIFKKEEAAEFNLKSSLRSDLNNSTTAIPATQRLCSSRFAWTLMIISIILTAIAIDAFFIEPFALQIKKITIKTSKIEEPIRIVLMTDIQFDLITDYERRVLQMIKDQKADLILLGGDYIQYSRSSVEIENNLLTIFNGKKGRTRNLSQEWNQLLKEMKLTAPLGVYAVPGTNKEAKLAVQYFKGTGINYCQRSESISLSDKLRLTCLGTHYAWFPDDTEIEQRLKNRFQFKIPNDGQKESGKFHIILGHTPSFFMGETAKNGDLLLAGHTHGGQVQLPFLGPILTMTPHLPRRWASGVTTETLKYSDSQRPRTLYRIVSHGVGMENGLAPRVRFLCRPDFWVIDLVPPK